MRDQRDFQIELTGSGVHEEHMHSAVQLLYVVEGGAVLSLRGRQMKLCREDVVLINAMEPHSYQVDREGIVCELRIEYRVITSLLGGRGAIFLLNSVEIPDGRSLGFVRHIFRELVWLEAVDVKHTDSRIFKNIYELLDILLTECRPDRSPGADGEHRGQDDESERLQRIIAYVHAHYQDSASLSALAAELYVSTSTLSRFFRKQTGLYFADYVNQVRLEYAAGELISTDKSLTGIAADAGFSTGSAFTKLFTGRYGMAPQLWRKDQQRERSQAESVDGLRKKLEKTLKDQERGAGVADRQDRVLIETTLTEHVSNPFRQILTIGSVSDLTRANVQFHLMSVARELHMTHVRLWSLFTEDLRVTDGKTIGVYNFNAIDTVLDVLVENRLAAYFDFGPRPDMAVRRSGSSVYEKETAVRFRSRRAWEALLESFISHIAMRYGTEEVSGWIFDFNEDPSYQGAGAYYEDPDYDFMQVWDHAFHTIRGLIPEARVGGPVGRAHDSDGVLRHFLREAVKRGCPPDFISVILFPYYSETADGSFERSPDLRYEDQTLTALHRMLESEGCGHLPVYAPEWNLSLSTRNFLNDSCFRGAYYAERAGILMRHTKMAGLWVTSDWVSSYFDSRAILHGGSGLLTRDTIRKPAYFALQFMTRLGSTLLHSEEGLVVTMMSRDHFMILMAAHAEYHVGYFLKEEDLVGPADIDAVTERTGGRTRELVLCGLEDGREYIVKTRVVNRSCGSVLDEWNRLKCETALERADVKYLQGICVPHMSMERVRVREGRLTIRVPLAEQEFRLIHVYARS